MGDGLSINEMLEQVESSCQSTWESAEVDWFPPDGEYTLMIGNVSAFQYKTKAGDGAVGLRVEHRFVGPTPDANHETFVKPYFLGSRPDASAIKGLASLLDVPTTSFKDSVSAVATTAVGKIVQASAKTVDGKQGGKFFNLKYLALVG